MKSFIHTISNNARRILFLLIVVNCSIVVVAQKKITPEEYIRQFKDEAITEMVLRKIPASVTLAQGMLETNFGNSDLAKHANNHFGIKCHKEWEGKTYMFDDDEQGECFRIYSDVIQSFLDHSLFLYSRPWYSFLFDLPINDYTGWCYGLKQAGYATDPKYAKRLVEIIETYKLYELDQKPL